ncbi:MAG TPA: glycosyltransferase, partial [Vicinamibacterales bacterium]|nr:glycosyltransferase [Vicinamibacterales bacterium]
IYNAVDWAQLRTDVGRDEARSSLGLPSDAPVAGVIARLTAQKGHAHLFNALGQTPELASTHLVVIGDGDLRDRLQQRVDSLGLASRVHFVGARRDLGTLLRAMDVFVLPSLWEGLPLSLLLAMGAGVPVVASSVGGVPEVVEDQRTGLLVPPGDERTLAKALTRVITDPALGRQLADAARPTIAPRFGVDRYVASVAALYDRLLAKAATRHSTFDI